MEQIMDFSQETQNIILGSIYNLQSSPEDPPVNRRELSVPNNDTTVGIQVNRYQSRKSADMHKVLERNGSKTLFLPRDRVITVDVKYHQTIGANLWVRVFPVSTNKECQNMSIVSCSEHKKHILSKHTNNNASHVLNSILELNDPTTVYEKILLPGGECQISTRVKYCQPETPVYIASKCYNTCADNMKRSLPKFIFSIESFNEDKEEYTVLSETSLRFKVCASPARDFKTESLLLHRNRLSLKSTPTNPNNNLSPQSPQRLMIGAKKYVLMMMDESEVEVIGAIRKYKNGTSEQSIELQEIERRANERLSDDLSAFIKVENYWSFCPSDN